MTARYPNQNCGPWPPLGYPSTRPACPLLIQRPSLILPVPTTRQNCLRDCHCRRSFMPGQWAAIFSARPARRNSSVVLNSIPILMSAPAATAGFRTLEAERIALIHAPFFTDDFDQKGVAYFQERGFEVVHVSHMMPPVAVPHPNTGSVARPAEIYEWVRRHVPSSAQAVFIGGNAVRAIGTIAALEEDLRRPILTANQVSLWHALRVAGTEVAVDGYGQL